MKKNFVLVVSGLLLSSCGSFVPTTNLANLSPAERQAINKIEIINQTQLFNKKFKVLNIVEGHSCQNKVYDPPATRAGAIEQMRYEAFQIKGDGITNIQCSGKEGTSLRTNCWELVSCTAEVIKFEN